MERRNAFYRAFYACCRCRDGYEEVEKSALISDTQLYFNREAKRKWAEEENLWNEPQDVSHTERDDDRELYNLLQRRSKTRQGSEGYRRLSFDIGALRQVRRDLKYRWKMILETLGFSSEADALLSVTSSMTYKSLKNASEAWRLLQALAEKTSIFEQQQSSPPERYLFVLDRLILLDVGEDFVSRARQRYPPESKEQPKEEHPVLAIEATPVLIMHTSGEEPAGGEEGDKYDSLEGDEENLLVNLLD
uniref:Melanoregulin-like n=1 Tax=Geotrypetes seraphini TaxID=260995 RepID=A0A6P8P129_GEOSA|nr:melanoregulin-like [Geotrypetes seraphini]